MAPKIFQPLFLLLLLLQLYVAKCRVVKPESLLQNLERARKGDTLKGLNQVKQYLKTFGYYPNHIGNNVIDDDDQFDEHLESALRAYQQYYNLEVTGKIDPDTIKAIMTPRCGVADINHNLAYSDQPLNYTIIDRRLRWRSYNLTYGFATSSVQGVSMRDLSAAIDRAYTEWADISPFRFRQAGIGANMRIGFYRRDHGDGYPFDGPGGVTAHAFAPQIGKFDYDADENWSINPNTTQMDLESIAVHEIGHLLGLGHSNDRNAIMFPYLSRGTIKRELTQDDKDGLKDLYGY